MTSAFSWQNSVSLCPASFCAPTPPGENERDPVGPSQGQTAPTLCILPLPPVCKNSLLGFPGVPKNKYNQKSEKMQKQRKIVKQD